MNGLNIQRSCNRAPKVDSARMRDHCPSNGPRSGPQSAMRCWCDFQRNHQACQFLFFWQYNSCIVWPFLFKINLFIHRSYVDREFSRKIFLLLEVLLHPHVFSSRDNKGRLLCCWKRLQYKGCFAAGRRKEASPPFHFFLFLLLLSCSCVRLTPGV